MKSRILWVTILFLLTCFPGGSQNIRVVRGFISDERGNPLKEVSVTTNNGEQYLFNNVGQFELRVPSITRTLTFSSPYYFPVEKEIDGSLIMVTLKFDTNAYARVVKEENRVKKEEEARIQAEEEAKKKADEERIAALEKEQKEVEARLKAEEEARIAAEEKARKEAEAKAKAEENARLKAEKQRQAAEAKAQAKAVRQEKDAAYNEKYCNRGLAHSVRVSYAYQLAKVDMYYVYSGYRGFNTLHPMQLDYALSYKINRFVSVGAGVGALFDLLSVSIVGDNFVCPDFKEHRWDIPVFATASFYFGRWRVRPSVSLYGGYYPMSRVVLAEGMVGVECRLGRKLSLEAGGLVKTTPYPYIDTEKNIGGYKMAISPGAAVRFNF